jgi:hypothetical protein
VSEVRYGPSTRLIDDAVELRQRIWDDMELILHTIRHTNTTTATTQAASDHQTGTSPLASMPVSDDDALVRVLLLGVRDGASEVLLRVHACVPLFLQSVDLDVRQWRLLTAALLHTLTASPPQNGVREELVAHEEVIRSAARAATTCAHTIAQIQQWTRDSGDTEQLDDIRQRLIEAVRMQQQQQEKDQKELYSGGQK